MTDLHRSPADSLPTTDGMVRAGRRVADIELDRGLAALERMRARDRDSADLSIARLKHGNDALADVLVEDGAIRINTDDVSFEIKPQTDAAGVEVTLIVWAEKFSDPDRTTTFEVTDPEWDAVVEHVERGRDHAAAIRQSLRAAFDTHTEVVLDLANGVEVPAGFITSLSDRDVWVLHDGGWQSTALVANVVSALPADLTLDPRTMQPRPVPDPAPEAAGWCRRVGWRIKRLRRRLREDYLTALRYSGRP